MPRVKTAIKRAPIKRRASGTQQPAGTRRRGQRANASGSRRIARRRHARHTANKEDDRVKLEIPPPMYHRATALIESAWPSKRPTSNAWDDRLVKRTRVPSLIRLPWDAESETQLNQHERALEKPRYVAHDLFGNFDLGDEPTLRDRMAIAQAHSASEDPIAAMGLFSKLPTEIRDMIFRNLLLHHKDIRVLRGWSLLFPRSRPNLEANLLRVCRIFYRQGIRILYGENSFVYLIRDPSSWRADTHLVVQHVYDRDHIPIDKYGHMIRRIKVVVEANRMRLHDARGNLPKALKKFLPEGGFAAPAQLQTVTLELPVQTRAMLQMDNDKGTKSTDVPVCSWFRGDSSVLSALKNLNCQFIRLLAYTHENEFFEALIDRRSHFSQLSADEGNFDTWGSDNMMLANRRGEAIQSRARLNSMYYWLEQLAGGLKGRDQGRAISEGPFRRHIPKPDVDDPLEALLSSSSRRAVRGS